MVPHAQGCVCVTVNWIRIIRSQVLPSSHHGGLRLEGTKGEGWMRSAGSTRSPLHAEPYVYVYVNSYTYKFVSKSNPNPMYV